jgi:hypothetical protein
MLGWGVAPRCHGARTAARTDLGTPRGPRSMHRQSNAQGPPWQRLRLKRGCGLSTEHGSMARPRAGAPVLLPAPSAC